MRCLEAQGVHRRALQQAELKGFGQAGIAGVIDLFKPPSKAGNLLKSHVQVVLVILGLQLCSSGKLSFWDVKVIGWRWRGSVWELPVDGFIKRDYGKENQIISWIIQKNPLQIPLYCPCVEVWKSSWAPWTWRSPNQGIFPPFLRFFLKIKYTYTYNRIYMCVYLCVHIHIKT